MAQGFTLLSDSATTVYRKLKIASGTAILSGSVLDRVRGSSTVDVQLATASSTTASIYAVAVSTASSTDTTILAALINPETQLWQADCGATGGGTASAAQNGQRMIFGTQTITLTQNVSTLGTTGVVSFAIGTSFANVTTVNNTGSDVTGPTGVFEQKDVIALVSTSRVIGRFLNEHAE
jgi:hypothetical protein